MPSVSAPEIERFVIEQNWGIGRDPAVLAATRRQVDEEVQALESERAAACRQAGRDERELQRLAGAPASEGPALARVADLQERRPDAERRNGEIQKRFAELQDQMLDEAELKAALTAFDPVWESLVPREQTRVVQLLVQRVTYDGADGVLEITFHPSGIRSFGRETSQTQETAA